MFCLFFFWLAHIFFCFLQHHLMCVFFFPLKIVFVIYLSIHFSFPIFRERINVKLCTSRLPPTPQKSLNRFTLNVQTIWSHKNERKAARHGTVETAKWGHEKLILMSFEQTNGFNSRTLLDIAV